MRTAEPMSAALPYRDPPKLRALRHVVRTRLSEHPRLYLPLARRRHPGPSPKVIDRETEFVIDGYTRSACTFAVYAFQLAQRSPVRLAHHLHAPAQLMEAARRGVPALVVIREPAGTVLSQVLREPHVALRDALVSYARFYDKLLPAADAFVAGEFEDVTSDLGSVIRRVNRRFGTRYVEFDATPDNVGRVFDLVRHRPTDDPELRAVLLGFESGLVSREVVSTAYEEIRGSTHTRETPPDTWIPSAERRRAKDALRERWNAPELTGLRERAFEAFTEFVRAAG